MAVRNLKKNVDDAARQEGRAASGRYRFAADSPAGIEASSGERASGAGVVLLSAFVFAVVLLLFAGLGVLVAGAFDLPVAIVSFVAAVLATMSVHIAQQWERVVVLRLGKFNRVSGPGLFWTMPFIEQNAMRVDCRVRATDIEAEETLTADLVPLDVNAVASVDGLRCAGRLYRGEPTLGTVKLTAQAALRDAIGQLTAAEVAIRREQLDIDIKRALEDEASQWGVSVLSVKVRDILLPPSLQDAMSLEAQAEQRRKARIILMDAEQDVAAVAEEVGEAYGGGDAALRLRAMHLLYESVRETGGTVVVPSSFSEGFGDVLPEGVRYPG